MSTDVTLDLLFALTCLPGFLGVGLADTGGGGLSAIGFVRLDRLGDNVLSGLSSKPRFLLS